MDFDSIAGMAVLERTPHTLRTLLAGLPPEWTEATEGPDTWSPYVIVGHLIHGERTDWIPRARIIWRRDQTVASHRMTGLRSFTRAKASHWRISSTSSRACAATTCRRSADGA